MSATFTTHNELINNAADPVSPSSIMNSAAASASLLSSSYPPRVALPSLPSAPAISPFTAADSRHSFETFLPVPASSSNLLGSSPRMFLASNSPRSPQLKSHGGPPFLSTAGESSTVDSAAAGSPNKGVLSAHADRNATDLVDVFLAMLQRDGQRQDSLRSSPVVGGCCGAAAAGGGSSSSSSPMGFDALTPPSDDGFQNCGRTDDTLGDTTAASTPTAQTSMEEMNMRHCLSRHNHHNHNHNHNHNRYDDEMTTSNRHSCSLRFDVLQDSNARYSRTVAGSSAVARREAALSICDPTVYSTLLPQDPTQWTGFDELISTLLTSASHRRSPSSIPSSNLLNSSGNSNSNSPIIDSLELDEPSPDVCSASPESNSLLAGFSSAIAAAAFSPGSCSLSSGLTSAFFRDSATVGDLSSMLSPSSIISRLNSSSSVISANTPHRSISMEESVLDTSPLSRPRSGRVMVEYAGDAGVENLAAGAASVPTVKIPCISGFNNTANAPCEHSGICDDLNDVGVNGSSANEQVAEQTGIPACLSVYDEENSNRNTLLLQQEEFEGFDADVDAVAQSMLFNNDGSLNLDFFKVFACKNETHVHDRKYCPFHHSQRDRRRLPVTYNAEQCDDHFDLEGDFACACPNGESCSKCHNRHELLYHPKIYKQRFCSCYNNLECHRGRFCAFAHAREEIRCDLFSEDEERLPKPEFLMRKFKTLWCPYGIQHDWHGCLYAHTYQDCRRSPDIGYGSEPCPYWQKDLHSADYQRRCPFGPRCPYSHGSKEQLYHPAYYKTMPCADYKTKKICPRGFLCAFYHDVSEKRSSVLASGSTRAAPADSAGTEGSEGSPDAVDGQCLYDYSRLIPTYLMGLLQPNFTNPPLFNLDDFEAFGHASRVGSGQRELNASDQITRQGSSLSRAPKLLSMEHPSFVDVSSAGNLVHHYHNHQQQQQQHQQQHQQHQQQQQTFFKGGKPNFAAVPFHGNLLYQSQQPQQQQQQPAYPLYNSNSINRRNFHLNSNAPVQNMICSQAQQQHQQDQRNQVKGAHSLPRPANVLQQQQQQQIPNPYRHNNCSGQRPPMNSIFIKKSRGFRESAAAAAAAGSRTGNA